MKPSSIIALIIAVLLVIVGLTTCIIAQNMANANGETLFSEVRSDGLVNTLDLSEIDFSKIELLVSDADINIYGKASSPYIEFVNFRENYYTLSTSNHVLSFDEIPDVMSMLKFWENGFSFKGMRYIFNFQKETEGRKVINVYLNANAGVKIINITANNSTITMQDLTWGSDYNFNLDKGEINVTTLKTTSSFKVTGDDITINMGTAILANLEVDVDNLTMDASALRINTSALIKCEDGNLDISLARALDTMNLDITSASGVVSVNGLVHSSPFRQNVPDAASITIESDSANVTLKPTSGSSETDLDD